MISFSNEGNTLASEGFHVQGNRHGLTIVVPCLNEAENIELAINDTLHEIDARNLDGEVIVVNDGSSDDSLAIINRIASTDKRIHIINKGQREGVGKAFWDGANMATMPFVVMFPGDNENSAAEVLGFYHLVNDVDLVIPFILNAEVRSIGRRFVSSIYRLIVNLSFGTSLNYTNGMVIYNKAALMTINLRSVGFFYQTELLIKLLRRGFLYAEVPQFLRRRVGGQSKALTLSSFLSLVGSFVKLVIDIHVLRVEGDRRKAVDPPVETATFRKLKETI